MSPVRKEVTAVSKRLGKMDMVVENLRTFQESCGLMMQSHYCKPHDPRMGGGGGVSVCLSVCLSVYSRISLRFLFRGGGGGEHVIGKETGKLVVTGACGDRKLRTELQCIS